MIDTSYWDSDEENNEVLMLSQINPERNGTMEISLMVMAHKRKPPSCIISVNNNSVKCLADSGLPFTLMNIKDFGRIDDIDLHDSSITFFAYEGKRVEVTGKFEANLKFDAKLAVGPVYVVKDGTNLLGWDERGEFGFILDPKHPDMVLSKSEAIRQVNQNVCRDWVKDYPEVFSEELGKLKGFQHRILLKKRHKGCSTQGS
ncbi:hypothetical protein NDU88_004143 [Pleurodeles waltl]|uniref:Uncharacterized protein n=1 Tax=Pleurodeles waltl TaxID=8319 RepID=A0AAV7SHZ8_PLEWA|nr:hypothetical protein NDU88_004143 [Pleurodeles waltl]